MTLDQLACGQCATVKKIGGSGAIRRRLMDMGFIKGVSIEVLRAAPLGDPVEYRLHGYYLALRKSEARLVEVES